MGMLQRRNLRRSSSQRGAIAVIAYFLLVAVLLLTIAMVEIGLQAMHHLEAHNAAEAIAVEYAYNIMMFDSPVFGEPPLVSAFRDNNTQPTDNVALHQFLPIYNNTTLNNVTATSTTLPYQPPTWQEAGRGYAEVTGLSKDVLAGRGSGLAGSHGLDQFNVVARAYAAVDELTWPKLQPVPARIALVLDYSPSMKLQYANTPPHSAKDAAINVLKGAVNAVITNVDAAQFVNWGLVLFASTAPAASQVQPVPEAQSFSNAALSAHEQAVITNVGGQIINGSKTDLANALYAATKMLTCEGYASVDTQQDSSCTGTALQYPQDSHLGQPFIIVITDGEPDFSASYSPSATYATNVKNAWNDATNAALDAQNHGITILTLLINRQQYTSEKVNQSGVISNLVNISGSLTSPHDATKFHLDQDAGNDVQTWILSQFTPYSLKPHCLAPSFSINTATSWMSSPSAQGLIFGHWTPNGSQPLNEAPVTRVTDPAKLDPPGVAITPATVGRSPGVPPQFYYNPKTKEIETNVAVCIPYLQAQQAGRPTPIFRARWGLPLLSNAPDNWN